MFNKLILDTFIYEGTLMSWTDWGPGQPTGGDQHCMYMVGGDKGFQWADFHCGYQVLYVLKVPYYIMVST